MSLKRELAGILAEKLGFKSENNLLYTKGDLELKINISGVSAKVKDKFYTNLNLDEFLLLGSNNSLLGNLLKYYNPTENVGHEDCSESYKAGFKDGLIKASGALNLNTEKLIKSWQL